MVILEIGLREDLFPPTLRRDTVFPPTLNSLLTCFFLKVPTQKVMELLDDFIDSIHSENKTQFKLAKMRMNTVILEGRYTNKTKEVGHGPVMNVLTWFYAKKAEFFRVFSAVTYVQSTCM